MYYLTKKFSFPMAHRLSKHSRDCKFLHGHNMDGEITVFSSILNSNDMVVDFHDIKVIIDNMLESWDHGLFLNQKDSEIAPTQCKLHLLDCDPTSEVLSKIIYDLISGKLPKDVHMDSVSLIETDGSKVTYKFAGQ